MDLQDEIVIPAPRAAVYAALNDPEVLKKCIPGCEELTMTSDTDLVAKVLLKVGPVKARFLGKVVLNSDNPPEHFSLSGEGNGGVAGFAKGGADVYLTEEGDATRLSYTAKAEIGGKLAQLGSRLVQGTAKKLSAQFFDNLSAHFSQSDQP